MKVLIGILLGTALSLTEVCAQNTAVSWAAFNMGFAATTSATTNAQSAAGQLVVGSAQSATTGTETGFIPGVPGILTAVQNSVVELPTTYALEQNYPNPFNPTTNIKYQIPHDGSVSLNVYNMLGQEVARLVNEVHNAGSYEVAFDASNLSSGMYIYRLRAGNFTSSRKLLLLR